MQCQAGMWLASRYHLLYQLYQDGPLEHWQAQWQDPAGYGGEATVQIPLPIFLQHQDRLREWQAQAYTLHTLQHPNVIRLYELGTEHDTHFVASESLEGISLYQLIQFYQMEQSFVPWPMIASIAARIAEGLAFAHGCQGPDGLPVFHGDLRPENILLNAQGEVKIQHFGHLHLWGDLREAWPIQVKRRYAYAAPERWDMQGPADMHSYTSSTDLYGLGVLLYELLTNQIPYSGPNLDGIQKAAMAPDTPDPLSLNPRIPDKLNDLTKQLMHAHPDARVLQARDISMILEHLIQESGQTIGAQDLAALFQHSAPPSMKSQPSSEFSMPVVLGSSQDIPSYSYGEDEEFDPGESTMVSPNLLASLMPAEPEVQLQSLDPMDPRSRDDLEAPVGLFDGEEFGGTDIHASASHYPAASEGNLTLVEDSSISLDALQSADIDIIEEVDVIEEIDEFEVLEDLEEADSIIDLGYEDLASVLEAPKTAPVQSNFPVQSDFDLGEATFLQSAPLPTFNGLEPPGSHLDQEPFAPPTMVGPSSGALAASPMVQTPPRASSLGAIASGGGYGGPPVATPSSPSHDALNSPRARRHKIDDLSLPSSRTDLPMGRATIQEDIPFPPQGPSTEPMPSSASLTPMALGSLNAPGRYEKQRPQPELPGAPSPKRGFPWLLLGLLFLVGAGGGTGAWFWSQSGHTQATPPTRTKVVIDRLPDDRLPAGRLTPVKAPAAPDAGAPDARRATPAPRIQAPTPAPPVPRPQRATPRRRKRPKTRPRKRRRIPPRRRKNRPRKRPRLRKRRPAPTPTLPRGVVPRGTVTPPKKSGFAGAIISIKPACMLFLGKDPKGLSFPPLRIPLTPKRYSFRCIQRSKNLLHRFSLRVKASQTSRYSRTLQAGSLLIRSKPWATISVRGLGKIGKTGQKIRLYQGRYSLTLFKKGSTIPGPGMRKSLRVTIRPGQRLQPKTIEFPVLDDE